MKGALGEKLPCVLARLLPMYTAPAKAATPDPKHPISKYRLLNNVLFVLTKYFLKTQV
jgi:hypothetical protein